jgi:rhodanese-related sulfurtransferase
MIPLKIVIKFKEFDMNMKLSLAIPTLLTSLLFSTTLCAKVDITAEIESIEVNHNGEKVVIQRTQDADHKIGGGYDKTSRQCPPFCIQPSAITKDVETIAELEVLHYLKDKKAIVVDSRTPDWLARGTIPGSVNIPWTKINISTKQAWSEDMEEQGVDAVLQKYFSVAKKKGILNFDHAKTLVVFCNGAWCGQSANFIRTLLKKGYPVEKLKWYRGGMQAWESFGLTTIHAK